MIEFWSFLTLVVGCASVSCLTFQSKAPLGNIVLLSVATRDPETNRLVLLLIYSEALFVWERNESLVFYEWLTLLVRVSKQAQRCGEALLPCLNIWTMRLMILTGQCLWEQYCANVIKQRVQKPSTGLCVLKLILKTTKLLGKEMVFSSFQVKKKLLVVGSKKKKTFWEKRCFVVGWLD